MKKLLTRAVAALAIMSASFVAQAELKLATFDLQKVMAVSPQAQKIKTDLQAQFGDRMAEIQKIQKDAQQELQLAKTNADFWTQEQKEASQKKLMAWDNELKIKGAPLQQEIKQAEQQKQQELIGNTQAAINAYAKKNNIDAVLQAGTLIYISDKVTDITDEVIAALK